MTRIIRGVMGVVLAVGLLASCISAPPGAVQRNRIQWLTYEDKYMFQFVEWSHGYKYENEYWWMDWSTDGCSGGVPDQTPFYDFAYACRHHDFGYRNAKLLERNTGIDEWNAHTRENIDLQFLLEMEDDCDGRAWLQEGWCLLAAKNFYDAVRAGGGP